MESRRLKQNKPCHEERPMTSDCRGECLCLARRLGVRPGAGAAGIIMGMKGSRHAEGEEQ